MKTKLPQWGVFACALLPLVPVAATAQTVLYSNTFTSDFSSGESGTIGAATLYNVQNSSVSGSTTIAATGNAGLSGGQLVLTLTPSGAVSSNRAAASVFTLASATTPFAPFDFHSLVAGKKYSIEITASVAASTATDRLRIYWDDALSFNDSNLGNSETTPGMKLGVLLGSGTSLSSAGVKLLDEGNRYNTVDTASISGQTERTYRFEIDETGTLPTFEFFVDGVSVSNYYDTSGGAAVPVALSAFSGNSRYLYFDLFDNNISTTSAANAAAMINSLTITDLTAVPEPADVALLAGVAALGVLGLRRKR